MNSSPDRHSFIGQVIRDRMVQVYIGLCILTSIPYFLPNLTEYQLATIEWLLNTTVLLPFIAIVLWPLKTTPLTRVERGFWKALSFAFGFWCLVALLSLLWQIEVISGSIDIPIDFIYLGYYVTWLLALSFAPHYQRPSEYDDRNRWLLWAAILILSFSLFLYFILIPSQYSSDSYETWVPSMMFYVFMDSLLVVILYVSARHATTYKWRTIYTVLMASMVLFLIFDLLETVSLNESFSVINDITALTLLWNLPMIGMVISARARRFKLASPGTREPNSDKLSERPDSLISPIIMVSFVLPLLHMVMHQLGIQGGEAETIQNSVVLGSLIVFWGLAFAENRWLRQLNRLARAQAKENEELRIKNRVAEESARLKTHFLANVSHEIRTPMNGILGMSELILKEDMSPEHRKQIQLIKSSADGLLAVIDDILHYSKLGFEKLVFIEKPFNLKETVQQVLDLFHATRSEKGLEIQVEYDDNVPELMVGDASRYRQVLVNLLGNALKFTPGGTVSLEFSCTSPNASKSLLLTSVRDTGIGISEEHLEKVFEPFSQVEESNSRSFGGSGLGLAISKQIVEAQGGRIGVQSSQGVGSLFWFELPLGHMEDNHVEEKEETDLAIFASENRKILLAEDNEINQMVAMKQIEALGLSADIVNNGEEALRAVAEGNYSLVLMDCQMPKLDGIEATRQLRQRGYSDKDLPIIALTAHVFEEDRERCLDAGMNDFLSKPLSVDDLSAALGRWLSTNTETT